MLSQKGFCVNKRLLLTLLVIVLLLTLAHLFSENLHPLLHDRFDLDQEGNVPTWFSTILLYSIAGISYLILVNVQRTDDCRKETLFWGMLCAAFLFLSFDEAAQIHELLDDLQLVKWVFVYAPFVILFLYFYFYFLYCEKCERSFRNWLTVGILLYIGGGYLLEMLTYFLQPLPAYLGELEPLFEEVSEMVGAVLILVGVEARWRLVKD